jgi:hypothetical protein
MIFIFSQIMKIMIDYFWQLFEFLVIFDKSYDIFDDPDNLQYLIPCRT